MPKHQWQGPRSITQLTANAEQITDLRPLAGQRHASRHAAKYGQREAQRPPGGIATDQADGALLGHPVQTRGERLQPVGISTGQGQGQGKANRRRAHGGQIADRYAQRTLRKQKRVRRFRKMHPGNQGVSRNGQLLADRHLQQGTIVADPQCHAFAGLRTRRSGEVMTDQLELTQNRLNAC